MAVCPNCGNNLTDGATFCGSCGTRLQQSAPVFANAGSGIPLSDWDGGVLETVAASIVASLIISLTCGIGTPWAVCYLYKFILEHTKLDGRRLRFNGTGTELFGNWIVWLILTVITCGIYSLWVTPKLYKWIASHTHFE